MGQRDNWLVLLFILCLNVYPIFHCSLPIIFVLDIFHCWAMKKVEYRHKNTYSTSIASHAPGSREVFLSFFHHIFRVAYFYVFPSLSCSRTFYRYTFTFHEFLRKILLLVSAAFWESWSTETEWWMNDTHVVLPNSQTAHPKIEVISVFLRHSFLPNFCWLKKKPFLFPAWCFT